MKPSAILATKNKSSLKPSPSKKSLKNKTKAKADVLQTLALLKKYYPNAHCALHFENAFQLLVATILSAQCTDDRVNMVTPDLFKEFPDPQSMATAPIQKLEELVKSTGFYKNKARSLKGAAQILSEKHNSEIPKVLEDLILLPGVGRKTANVVLGNAFGIISGIVVDTHVTRLSGRFGWTRSDNAVIIERELQKIIPHSDWILISHLLISHGRAVCKARTPRCEVCFLAEMCPKKV